MIVIYHANCCDGFCAAWLLSKLFPDAEFLPFQYGTPAPIEQLRGREVIMVDFCFPRDEMLEIVLVASSLRVFDHHASVPEDLRSLPQFVFDEHESGCSLVWKYYQDELRGKFYPNEIQFVSEAHWLVDYIKDRDLWQWKLNDSDAINAGIRLAKFDFAEWDQLKFHKCLYEGMTIQRYRNQQVESRVKQAVDVMVEVDDNRFVVPCVNETNGDFISYVGEALASRSPDTPFGMTYFHRLDANGAVEYVFSLRSRNGFDVSEVAKFFGGGGHKAAAGFRRNSFFPVAQSVY